MFAVLRAAVYLACEGHLWAAPGMSGVMEHRVVYGKHFVRLETKQVGAPEDQWR